MATFDLIDGKYVLWLYRLSLMPFPVEIGDEEVFGKFVDEAIEFYNSHSKKSPLPLYILKEFYADR